MRNWDQQYNDLMQVQNVIYMKSQSWPSIIFILCAKFLRKLICHRDEHCFDSGGGAIARG